jgi:DNA-binding transcriptional MerR regulator
MTAASPPPEKLFLTPDEVAERYEFKVTSRTLANWRSQGISPPYTKVGGRILYRMSDLKEWEQSRTVSSTSKYKR